MPITETTHLEPRLGRKAAPSLLGFDSTNAGAAYSKLFGQFS